eukprot:TRINITY_DN16000_c0_g1_i1.p1 TRINITY_DN16000_c0_g1~~TRINITY_DN16000_c0_g1_i1.p1  ORF type:complete len:351 (+),score=90.14 TRINITY_DN16000_c0_g1_i1:63-1055(+)
MGYYNLPPSKLPTELNALEKLLRALDLEGATEALDLLETISRNTAQNPSEEKYRRLRTTNEKLAPLFRQPGIQPVMQEMGWQQEGEFMVLPKSVSIDFAKHVVKILEAKSHYSKLRETAKKTSKLADDPQKADMLRQLELDRRERAAGTTQAPAPVAATEGLSEEAQIEAAIKMSLEASDASAQGGYPVAPAPGPAVPVREAPMPASTAPAAAATPKTEKKPVSEFDFKRREDVEKKRQEQDMSLTDLRSLQKQKYKEFQEDPNARNSEAYQRPASVAGGKKEEGWFDWMWGGASSSSSGGGGGGGGGNDRKPRMKTMKDLPPPPRRGGG